MHGHINIVHIRAATDSNSAYEEAIWVNNGLSAAENNEAVIGLLYGVEVAAWLTGVQQGIAGSTVEEDGGFGFLVGDVLPRESAWQVILSLGHLQCLPGMHCPCAPRQQAIRRGLGPRCFQRCCRCVSPHHLAL